MGNAVHLFQAGGYFLDGGFREQSRNGQLQFRQDLAVFDQDDAAADFPNPLDGPEDIGIAGSGADQIMGIMGNGGGDGAFLNAKTVQGTDPGQGQCPVAFQTDQLGHGLAVGEVLRFDPALFQPGDQAARRHHQGAVGRAGQAQRLFRQRLKPDRRARPVQQRKRKVYNLPLAADQPAPGINRLDGDIGQIIDDQEISLPAGRQRAPVLQAVCLGRVEAGHGISPGRVNSVADGQSDQVVDGAVAQDIKGFDVIGAEEAAAPVVVVDRRQQRQSVFGGRAFTDLNVHPQPDPFFHFLPGGAFMLGLDATAHIGIQGFPRNARSVAVAGPVGKGRQLLSDGFGSLEQRRKVHHFPQTVRRFMGFQAAHLLRGQFAAGMVNGRGRHAGRNHEPEIQRQAPGGVHQPAHAGFPQDIGNFVRIRHYRGDAVGQHPPGILTRGHHGRFDVHMAVQKGRDNPAAGAVQLRDAFVVTDAGDPLMGNRQVGLKKLGIENIQQIRVFKDQVSPDPPG
ncbi:hypothetical protein DSECCO2_210450 [anaerobic digester metagenome]